jgi:TatD DNase family protein
MVPPAPPTPPHDAATDPSKARGWSLVDSHCHLDFPDFTEGIAAIVARAQAAGVTRMVTICTRLRSEPAVRAIAAAHPGVFYAAGTHPLSAHEEPLATLEALTALAGQPDCVGIGESGLDYHYSAATRDVQLRSFARHIEAAQATGLPLVVHARDADDDIARMLAEGMARAPFTGVMHCFSSGAALAEAALEMGLYLSMSGIAAFPKSDALRAIFARAPLERILVETDSPYLAPPPYRGRRNEPAYVVETATAGAALFGLTLHDFAAATSANFDRLFPRARRDARAA